MQNYCKTIGALVVASAFAVGNASAEIESEIHAGYSTDYLFRGLNLGNDLVDAGVNVASEWNDLNLSGGLWYGSFNQGGADFSETNIYGEVAKDLEFATLAVGYINYQRDRAFGPDSSEVYFSAAREFYGIDTSLTYFWDVENDNDGYTELAASKGYELSSCLTLNTGAVLGYLAEHGQAAHLTAKVSLDYAVTETATISPFIAHSWSLSDDVDTAYAGSRNELVAGTMLSVSF